MIPLIKTLGLMGVGFALNAIWIFFTWLMEAQWQNI